MGSPEFEEAKIEYERFREKFYTFLRQYASWDAYKEELSKTVEARFDKSNWIEQYLIKYYNFLTDRFLEQHPFLKPYIKQSDKTFILSAGLPKIKVELFHIDESDLYYPKILEIISCHSARHSLAMFIKEGILNSINRGHKLGLYTRPRTTHPGDREYTHYFFSQFEFPHVILTRQENLSWLLQTNGLMKQQQFGGGGRWCTRVWKTEAAIMFYRAYFYSWKYKFTVHELQEYCKTHGIACKKTAPRNEIIMAIEDRLKGRSTLAPLREIPPPNKTDPIWNSTKYPLFKWNQENLEWKGVDTLTNTFPIYEPVYKTVGNTQRQIGWALTDRTLKLDNIFQSIGINRYHSKKRRIQNPNFLIHPKSTPKSGFLIYNRHPIYEETPQEMTEIIKKSPIKLEENPFETEHPLAYMQYEQIGEDAVPATEERFGCIICPYRTLPYYHNLKEKYPWQYFYCMAIRLVASAKKILREGVEYWYEGEGIKDPIMRVI